MDADDALEDAERLLRGVAGFFFASGGDDGMPPDVGGGFTACGLGCTDQARSHVGDAVGRVEVEGVARGIFGVPEDVVVLGGPALGGAGTVIVGPDDFILKTGATEDLVEHDLAVVDFAVVDVEEERAGGGEYAVRFDEAGAEEAEEVVEAVVVAGATGLGGEDVGAVAAAAETDAVASFVADGFHLLAELPFAGVEGGIDVDELDGGRVHGLQNLEVVPLHNTIHAVVFRA